MWISNAVKQNGGYFSGSPIVGVPDFRSHTKSGPFANQPFLDQSKSGRVWISDPHCIDFLGCKDLQFFLIMKEQAAGYSFVTFVSENIIGEVFGRAS